MIDQFIYCILLVTSAQALKSYPAFPELGVFTMLSIVFIAAVFGTIEEVNT